MLFYNNLCYFTIICVIVKSKDNADEILDYLNNQHEKVKFTLEKESDNTLNFLDVKIKITEDF